MCCIKPFVSLARLRGANILPTGLEIGNGSQAVATAKNFATGELIQTGDPYNVAIQGDGFSESPCPTMYSAYTRDGAFKLNRDGQIVTSDGLPLDVPFEYPTARST